MMRFYTKQHSFYCGIDLHARLLAICIVDQAGAIVLQTQIPADKQLLLKALAPFRPDVVIAVECLFAWYWVADLCRDEQIPFVLGHALYMKAIHGGKAKNDDIDAEKIARLLKGGNIPVAYVYPKGLRETRDLLRRRMYLVHQRAALITHVQIVNAQYNLPEFSKKLIYARNRAELKIAERFDNPQLRKSVEVDLALIDVLDEQIAEVELHLGERPRSRIHRRFICSRRSAASARFWGLRSCMRYTTSAALPTWASFCRTHGWCGAGTSRRASGWAAAATRSAMPISNGRFPRRCASWYAIIRW
jgi:transposase